MYSDYPWDPKIVTVVDRCLCSKSPILYLKIVVVKDSGGRNLEVVVSSGLTVIVHIKAIIQITQLNSRIFIVNLV